MVLYEQLLDAVIDSGIYVQEVKLKGKIKGLYSDNVIWINESIPSYAEKSVIIAEELGHQITSFGDIVDQSCLLNRKQEKRARSWAYEYLVPINKIISAHQSHLRNRYELAEYLGVTEDFVQAALDRYIEKHGDHLIYENYTICFNPLGVVEWFDFDEIGGN